MFLRKGWNPIFLSMGLDRGETSRLEAVHQVATAVGFDGREVMSYFKLRGSTSSEIFGHLAR
jgi:hypothetical protein